MYLALYHAVAPQCDKTICEVWREVKVATNTPHHKPRREIVQYPVGNTSTGEMGGLGLRRTRSSMMITHEKSVEGKKKIVIVFEEKIDRQRRVISFHFVLSP